MRVTIRFRRTALVRHPQLAALLSEVDQLKAAAGRKNEGDATRHVRLMNAIPETATPQDRPTLLKSYLKSIPPRNSHSCH